jgi:predicted component of type VI protein secretion system
MNKSLALGIGILVGFGVSTVYGLIRVLNLELEMGKLRGKIENLKTECECFQELLEDEKRLQKILDEKLLETDEDLIRFLEE